MFIIKGPADAEVTNVVASAVGADRRGSNRRSGGVRHNGAMTGTGKDRRL
jgi:hypothetical protein